LTSCSRWEVRAGEGYALNPMLSPPLASLDPPRGRVMTVAPLASLDPPRGKVMIVALLASLDPNWGRVMIVASGHSI
jgi:hypothetical protein